MEFQSIKVWLPLLVTIVLAGCGGPLLKANPQPLTFAPESFPNGQYQAKADNVQILLDASQTMGNNGQENLQSAKNFVSAVNRSLPADFAANTGLRTFGHSERQSGNPTELVYGMAGYSRDELEKGVEKVKYAGGNSPLGTAINAAAADLEKAAGTSILVIVSDATQHNMDDALAAAQALKARMGDRLCIYTVWIGDDIAGQRTLEKVARAGGCGFAETGAALTGQKALAAFVEKVFLVKKPAPVPAPVVVPTPAQDLVKEQEIITFNLLFDFDKSTIKDDMVPILEQARKILNEDPVATFMISGHTDAIGTDAYNQALSERRAAAVTSWLINNGIASRRLDSAGYGESQPKYDNTTVEGRKLNRRVEIRTR